MLDIDSGLFMEFLGGSGGSSLPFTSDASTYVWDFTASNITTDATGTASISAVPEMVRGASHSLIQPVKASQPLVDANGALFSATEALDTVSGGIPPLNASAGLYVAAVLYMSSAMTSSNVDFAQIFNDTSEWPERFSFGIHFGGQIIFIGSSTDSGGPPTRGLTSAGVTKDFWHLIEMQWDLNGAVTIWIDQVAVALATDNPGTDTNFQTGDSIGLRIGGQLQGVFNHLAVYDGVIPATNRQSISDYLWSQKP